jgi:hypothetical protein
MRAPPSPPAPNLAAPAYADARDRFIRDVVRGKSFCDVGGLWGTVRERVSVADKAGASDLAMLDVTPRQDPLWKAFDDRMKALGVSDAIVRLAHDLHQYEGPGFDVVHCSGVLYHCTKPFDTVQALRRLTREYLILSSSVVPRVIENAAGRWELPSDHTWVCLPEMTEQEANVIAAHWRPFVSDTAIGLTRDWPKPMDPNDWAPWYWLPTVPALIATAEGAGFRLVDDAQIWHGMAHTLLLTVER